MLRGFTRKFKALEILTQEEIEAIHKRTLNVLWQVGVTFHHEKALQLFKKNDCNVDYEDKRVHFPPGLVEESLRKCPSNFRVGARNPENDLIIGGNTLHFTVAPGMQIVDLDTYEPRVATRKENYDGVTILDALDNLQQLGCYTPYFGFERVPPVMAIPESVAAKIRKSDKYQYTGSANECEIFNIEMAKAAGTEINGHLTSSSPLTYYSDVVEHTCRIAEAGFPINVCVSPSPGATGPASIAGSTVIANAEALAGIVLIQLLKPGARVSFGNFTLPLNMSHGCPAFGDIGVSLSYVVTNQIFRWYGIPIYNGAVYPSSKNIDFQCAYEKATIAWHAALSGANVIMFHGSMYGELAWHPLQAILDDDIAGMVGRFLEGVCVNDDSLALDLIEQVGPIPGNYLNTAHTREWWKKEQFLPRAADRLPYPEWIKTGKKDCLAYAKERMNEILATHKVSLPLTLSQEEEIERILNEARQYYKKKELISDKEWEVYMKDLQSPNYPFA